MNRINWFCSAMDNNQRRQNEFIDLSREALKLIPTTLINFFPKAKPLLQNLFLKLNPLGSHILLCFTIEIVSRDHFLLYNLHEFLRAHPVFQY